MGDLILSDFVKSDGEKAKTTSFKIAEKFDKEHKDVLKAIRNLECSESFNQRNFAPISYLDSYGRNQTSFFGFLRVSYIAIDEYRKPYKSQRFEF